MTALVREPWQAGLAPDSGDAGLQGERLMPPGVAARRFLRRAVPARRRPAGPAAGAIRSCRSAPSRPGARWLAIAAHVLLLLALAFGVAWQDDTPSTVAAELWSATPQAAAPAAADAPPPAPPPPSPTIRAAPRRAETPPAPAAMPTPPRPDPQIAIDQERRERARRAAEQEREAATKRQQAQHERDLALERQRARDEAAARDRQLAKMRADELARLMPLQQQKVSKADKPDKADQAARAAEAQKTAQAKAHAEKADAERLAKQREDNLKRMLGQAGATGSPTDTGTAQRNSAPSAGYAGRVAARIKPNIVFADAVEGNPSAVVQVRVAADGTIVGRRLTQSSGVKAWDDAVLRAIDRTEQLPLDSGRAPPQLEIGFRPKD